jgi:putative transposase
MPRQARIAPKECIYHVLTRGNNRQDVFKGNKDHKKYLEILQRYKERYNFNLYHYVLMRNHIHLVLETTAKGGSLSEVMKGINISYAQYYKKEYGYIGHFWQDRYKSILISKDNYLLACGSYVELNPVRARIVGDPRDYRWSSYAVYAYGRRDEITDEHSIYEDLSKDQKERRRKYREFVKAMVKDKGVMKGEMDKRTAYGSEGFLKKVVQEYNIDVVIKSQGRPKKGNINNK